MCILDKFGFLVNPKFQIYRLYVIFYRVRGDIQSFCYLVVADSIVHQAHYPNLRCG